MDPIAKKTYYSIGEVGEITGLKAHVLRYWESQFEAIRPTKNRAGNRVYRSKDIETVLLVKHLLYEKRFTIEGARQKLKELRRGGGLQESRSEILQPQMTQVIRDRLIQLKEVLTLPDA